MATIVPRRVLAVLLAVPLAAPALAQRVWPTRPVRLIVPFPAGTTADILLRALLPHLSTALGQPAVVENRAGAAGALGLEAVARATDGHTFGLGNNSGIATARAMNPNLPFDPQRDLVPVALLARTPQVLVIGPSVNATTLAGFLDAARGSNAGLTYGSIGAGSASHLAMEELALGAGLRLVHVPYRGFPQVTVDMMAGRVDALFCPIASVLGLVREGKLKALAVTAAERAALLPEVPTLAESGIRNGVSFGWNGIFAPAGTLPPVTALLAEELRKALEERETRQGLESAGFDVAWMGPDGFAAFVVSETARWGGLIQRLGIRADG